MKNQHPFQLEYDTLLEEYKSLRDEINSTINSSRQLLGLSLTAIGVLIAAGAIIVNNDLPTLFLIVPLFFYGIAWAQLRYIYITRIIGNYIQVNIIARLREILTELSSDQKNDFSSLMTWESQGSGLVKHFGFWIIPIESAEYWIPLLAACLSIGVYVVFVTKNSYTITFIDNILLMANTIAVTYSIVWGVKVGLRK